MSEAANYALLLEKLNNIDQKTDRIEQGVERSDRTLRGHNGDGGLVAKVDKIDGTVERIDDDLVQCKKDVGTIQTTLHGDGEDKIGIVGEQVIIRRLNKWLIGIGTSIFLTTIGMLIKIWFFSPAP